MKKIRDIKEGEYFRFKKSETAAVWVRGKYVRSERRYSVYKFDDTNHERFVPGQVEVYVDFTF